MRRCLLEVYSIFLGTFYFDSESLHIPLHGVMHLSKHPRPLLTSVFVRRETHYAETASTGLLLKSFLESFRTCSQCRIIFQLFLYIGQASS